MGPVCHRPIGALAVTGVRARARVGAAGVAERGAPDWGEPRRWGSGEAIGAAAGSHGAVQQKRRRCGTGPGGGTLRRAQMAAMADGVAASHVQRRRMARVAHGEGRRGRGKARRAPGRHSGAARGGGGEDGVGQRVEARGAITATASARGGRGEHGLRR